MTKLYRREGEGRGEEEGGRGAGRRGGENEGRHTRGHTPERCRASRGVASGNRDRARTRGMSFRRAAREGSGTVDLFFFSSSLCSAIFLSVRPKANAKYLKYFAFFAFFASWY